MLKSIFEILSFLLYLRETNCKCIFMPYGPILYPNLQQIQIDLNLPDQVVQNQQNIGYGVWTKYQPFAAVQDLRSREQKIDITINKSTIIQGGQFIYSMKQKESGIQILVVSLVVDQIEQSFQYNIYYSFKSSSNLIQFNIRSTIIEGLWIMFYVYFDQLSQKTTFGLYNSLEPLQTYLIHGVPNFLSEIRHNIGGIYAYQNRNGVLVQLTQFFGRMSNLFTSYDKNVLSDLEQCVDQFMIYDTCENEEYRVSEKNQRMNGFDFISTQTSPLNIPIYLLQGWIKLDLPDINFLETIVFRITINYNYNDDIYIGDREVLLRYLQSTIPGENGFEISTYSYTFPVKTRYITEDDDKISDFGDQYSSMFVTWHYFQYEIGTLNNNGQPLFTLYFPSLNQYYKYVWSKPIKHFTGVTYLIYIGGDNYAKSFLQGYVSDILFYLYCKPQATSIEANCDYKCLDCDGPTSVNCLSCSENSHRLFSRTGQTCNCEQGYVDVNGEQECLSAMQMFPQLTKQEIQLDCNIEGYSSCEGLKVECDFGYFLFKNQCVQCPEYSQFKYGVHISCFDCFTQPLTFSQSLTCTMDAQTFYSNSKYLYQIVQRDENNWSYYGMQIQDDSTYVTKLCFGCTGYQKCRERYYYMDDQCNPCIKNCLYCQNSYSCEICQDDHYLGAENQCLKCPNCTSCFMYQEFLWCSYCEDNEILQDNACIPLGVNCNSYDLKGYCEFCIGDPSKYYLTIDGRNCIECNIENCQYCFEYVIISGEYYTTLDIDFNIYDFNSNQINFGCALCNKNYNYNQRTQKCELKLDNDDCEFAVILDSTQQQQCIISLKNDDAVQVTSCSSLQHCNQCIHQYIENGSYCIQCDDGYYSSILTGQCQLCTNNCKTCLQQNSIYKDYWKWSVKAFYKFFVNFNNDKSFEDYKQSNAYSEFEVMCTSCQLSYILFEQKCIKGCEENCNKCEIIDGKATCIQCQETDFGFLKSKNTNGMCLQCPSNCIACVERDQKEILDINPYYNLNNQNARYTRKCFEKSKNYDNYYFDFLTQTITVCTSNKKCYNKYLIKQNIFCDRVLYQQSLSDSQDDQFQQKNILLNQFYSYEYLNLYEPEMIYQYLNEAQVRHVEFQFTLIQGNETECYIEEDLHIYSQLQQNIFTLQQIDIILIGQTYPTIVTFFNEISFINYTAVAFKNIKFNFFKRLSNEDAFLITIQNLKYQLILTFENCIFTMPSIHDRNISLIINTNIPYSLVIQNFTITNFYVSSSDIFTFMSFDKTIKNTIQISNLTILDSYFFNSTLFRYQANKNILIYDTFLNQTQIQDTIFFQSNFIHNQGLLNYITGNLWIKQIMLSNVHILFNSSIFLLSCFQSLLISDLTLFNSKIIQNSSFYSSNIINLKNGIINNTYITNSYLINNLVEYSKSESALYSSSKALIENYQIFNTQYDDKQQIIKIIKYNEIDQLYFSLIDFSIMNSQLTSQIQLQEISYYSSMIYCECQLCHLERINLLRGHGLPEMTFLYSEFINISNFSISSNQIYITKPLHSSLECIEKFTFKDMHFFLYIGFYQIVNINNLQIQNSLSFNNPFVILQGYDLMQRLLSEVITIVNVKFYSNLLLIIDSNKQTALLSIISQQNCLITLQMLNYTENHLNEYFQDSTRISATTAFISLYQGFVMIQSSHFIQNIVTNSSDSILYIKSAKLEIRECTFTKSNIINQSQLSHYFLYSEVQDLSSFNLIDIFPIKALSGNGMIITQSLIIEKTLINQSYATSGGAFHIVTQGKSSILIVNSHFSYTNTLSDLSMFSIGGCLYIDGSASQLQFIIRNSTIETSYSRNDAGAIYILPSESYNRIELEQLIVIDCFSLQNSFFSYKTPKLESIDTQIMIKNINFYSTELGFNRFIQSINGLTEQEAYQIAHSNPQIFIQYGYITILNCNFLSTQFQFLIKINQAYDIYLSNITIQNSTFLQSPLIELNLKEKCFGKIIINNLHISNVDQFKKSIQEGQCKDMESVKTTILECPLQLPTTLWSYQFMDNIQMIKNQLLCNQLLIFQNKPFNFSLINIESLDNTHQVVVKNMILQNVNCNDCLYGLFQIFDIQQQRSESLQFQSIKIENCICGQAGCLSILKNKVDVQFRSELSQSNRLLQHSNLEDIEFTLDCLTIISDSIFSNNSAHYGGSLFVQEVDVLIIKSLFYNNSAEIGGAIYFFSKQKQLYFYRTQFINNRASVAGVVFLNNQSLQLTKELEIEFSDNNSTQYGQNVFEKPRSLSISIDGGKTLLEKEFVKKNKDEIIEQIKITPYKILGYSSKVNQLTLPSGRSIQSYQYYDEYTYSFIPYNLTFRIIALDKFNNQNKGLYDSSCTLKPMAFNLSSQTEVAQLPYSLSKYHAFFNNNTGDYNLDDLIIYWNPNYDQDLVLRISIECNEISVPFYSQDPPYLIQSQNTNYTLLVDIRTFQCQLGEFLNYTTGGCMLCDKFQNQYQVSRNALNCSYKDDTKIRLIESSMIELRQYYWRAYNYSQNIEYCYHSPKNCQGGWKPGDKSCVVGHIGALCEQCDLYNIRGQGSFYLSSAYQCINCKITVYNVLSITFVVLWTLLSTLISVISTTEMITEFIASLRLRLFGVRVPIKQISTAILIKVFTNYLQIISTLFTFQLEFPPGLSVIINSCANPIESMAFSLDCYLYSFTDILIIYFRVIWSLVMALSYILIFIGLGALAIAFKLVHHDFSFITISLIYLFIYLQPNLIGQLISLLSYRKISDEFWISSNVAYRYDTSSHLKWIVAFNIPLLTFLCITIPTILWYGVYKNRQKLDKTTTRKTWGYLYHEYIKKAYFWETIKIFQKELIILARIYYDDQITIKASLIFLLLFTYSHFAKSINPYMTKQLNILDQQSIIICAVSIVLACSIHSAQQQNLNEITWPFYVIIVSLNSFYITKLIVSIILAYFKRIFDKIDSVKQKLFAYLPLKFRLLPKIQKIFETRQNKLTRIQRRFSILKEYLLILAKENLRVRKFKQEQQQQRENSHQLHQMILQYSLKGRSLKYSDHNRRQSQLSTFGNHSRICSRPDEEQENQFWRIQTQRQESQIL